MEKREEAIFNVLNEWLDLDQDTFARLWPELKVAALAHLVERTVIQITPEAVQREYDLRNPQTEYEYGTRWVVEGAPGGRRTYFEGTLEVAQWVIEEDRIAIGAEKPRGILVRRLKVGEWEEVE